MKSLQSKYRETRDEIFTYENEKFYFAYKITDDKSEIHIEEIFIAEEYRGNSLIIFAEIVELIKEIGDFERIIGFIFIPFEGSERSMMAMLKFGFRLHSYQQNRIVLNLEL